VALGDIADDESGELAVAEVFEVRKAAGEALTQGSKLYWDADGNPQGGTAGTGCLTATATDNTYAGVAFAAAGATAETVAIKLNA
jgi:predicted RecA/RadA family phage recombinase